MYLSTISKDEVLNVPNFKIKPRESLYIDDI